MKLFFVSLIVLVFSVSANAEENNTELSFYSGIFDTIEDEGDNKSKLFGLEHKNTNLFRKTLSLPSNVSTGLFNVIIMHYRKGLLISREESSIKISKSGISASIYNIAQEYSALYGIIAVVLAVFIGWFANMIFRRI